MPLGPQRARRDVVRSILVCYAGLLSHSSFSGHQGPIEHQSFFLSCPLYIPLRLAAVFLSLSAWLLLSSRLSLSFSLFQVTAAATTIRSSFTLGPILSFLALAKDYKWSAFKSKQEQVWITASCIQRLKFSDLYKWNNNLLHVICFEITMKWN